MGRLLGTAEWDAKQTRKGMKQIPPLIANRLTEIGIDASMWRDMVWEWQKFFGKTACIGSPEAMKEHASKSGRNHHRGQASLRNCFTGT
ncbi:MAG: hypothetical protein AAFV88_00355 [Planctomycetota bacterium]